MRKDDHHFKTMANSGGTGEKVGIRRAQRRVSITFLACYVMWEWGQENIKIQ